MSSLK
jgi:hypothetical protein